MPEGEALHASHRLEYPYSRSVGPVIGAFLTALRDGRLLGVQGAGGSVIVPPTEYDPTTGDDTGEMVEVGPGGAVDAVVLPGGAGYLYGSRLAPLAPSRLAR